jgi:serine/threonine protein kinase
MATKGKKCGESYIPKGHKCIKGQLPIQGELFPKVAKIAAVAGLATGAAFVLKNKLSDTDADRIISEAIEGGKKWDVHENLKKRGGDCRTDAKKKARCRVGGGAYGDYYVHTSQEYGVKVIKEDDQDAIYYEANMLEYAHSTGAPVPQFIAQRGNAIVMEHMRGYKTVEDVFGGNKILFDKNTPVDVKLQFLEGTKKLHAAGIAHGDLHNANVLYNPETKKLAFIDWGYSAEIEDRFGANPSRGYSSGSEILQRELLRLPMSLGLDNQLSQKFSRRYNTAFDKALEDPQKNYDILLNRYYKDLEKHVKMAGGLPVGPQSKLVGEVIQGELKFPRPIVMSRTRNQGRNPRQREAMTMEAGLPKRNLEPRKIIPTKPQPFGTPMQPASTAKPVKAKTQTFVRKALAAKLINNNLSKLEPTQVKLLQARAGNLPHKDLKSLIEFAVRENMSTPAPRLGGASLAAANKAFRRRDARQTPHRADAKCGNSYIAKGKKCRKGQGLSPRGRKIAAAAGVGLTAGLVAAALMRKPPGGGLPTSGVGTAPPGNPGTPSLSGAPAGAKLAGLAAQRRLTGLTPKGLLPPSPPRKSKTQRMRENTSASIKIAEQRIGQTAKEEVRRLAQIGNTMAAAGEASGNVVKTTMRELRLRAEAARRKYEPGYRKEKPKQLTSGALRLPMRAKVEQRAKLKRMDSLTPSTVRSEAS